MLPFRLFQSLQAIRKIRVAPRFPGDSPFKPNQANLENGPRLIRKRLWYAVGGVTGLVLFVVILPNLEQTPLTNRWRLMLVSSKQESRIGTIAAESLLRQNAHLLVPRNDPLVLMVHKVTKRILAGAMDIFPELFPETATLNDVLRAFPITVIRSPMINASVLPDGSIFVFSGILPVAQEEAGLATVLSHEIAHKLLRHHGERISLYSLLLYFGIIGQIAIDSLFRSINDFLMRVGVLLPNSRKTELEADHIGLLLMAAACYNPQESLAFWKRMEKAAKSSQTKKITSDFLSTHPEHGKRSENLQERMKDAMKIWDRANCNEHLSPFWSRFPRSYW